MTKRVSKDNIENKPRIGEGLKNFKTTYKTTTIDNDFWKSRKFKNNLICNFNLIWWLEMRENISNFDKQRNVGGQELNVTRMTTFIKTKFNKSDDQTNIDNIELLLILI